MINFLRSFSFRAGLIVFCVLSATLILLRLAEFKQTEESTYKEIRTIIGTNLIAIDEVMERDGPQGVISLVKDLVHSQDMHLHLGYVHDGRKYGNLDITHVRPKTGWQEQRLSSQRRKMPASIYFKARFYPAGQGKLVVGYDLERIEQLHHWLLNGLLEYLMISLVLASFISALLIWMLNRHLQRFNQTFARVIAGDLSYRLPIHHVADQFDRLGANLNTMLEWMQTLVDTVRDSTNAIAHDLRTPLSRHRLELQGLLQHHRLSAEIRELLGKSIEQVDKLVEMFDNILNIAKAESRAATEVFNPTGLTGLVQDIIDFYAPLLDEKKQQIHFHAPEEPLILAGDKQLLGQAILNLIDNAVKYSGDGATITLTLQKDAVAGKIILTVADNGPGIPAEMLEKVKERFFRLDESRNTTGSGLGLSLVEAVAKLHRGSFTLEGNHPGLKAILQLHC